MAKKRRTRSPAPNWYSARVDRDIAEGLRNRVEEAEAASYERRAYAELYAAIWNSSDSATTITLSTGSSALEARIADWLRTAASGAPVMIRNTLRSLLEPIVNRRGALDSQGVVFMTTGGTLEQRTAARELTEFCEGLLRIPHGAYQDSGALFRSGLLMAAVATGSAAVFPVYCAATEQFELQLDDTLSLYVGRGRRGGAPREVVRRVKMTAAAAEDEFECTLPPGDLDREVEVYEGWVVATANRLGTHSVAVCDGDWCEVWTGDWDHREVPMALFHVSPPLGTDWAPPLSHHVRNALALESQALSDWADALKRLPAFLVQAPAGGLVDPQALSKARNVAVVETKGNAAAVSVTQVQRNSADALGFSTELRQGAQDVLGVNEAAIRGDRTEGTRSGKHESFVAALSSERQAMLQSDVIAWRTIQVARALLLVMQAAVAADRSVRALIVGERNPRKLAFESLDLSGMDSLALRPEPVSGEVASPRARRETLERRLAEGVITQLEYQSALDHLDSRSGGEDLELIQELTQAQLRVIYAGTEVPLAPPPGIGVAAIEHMQRCVSRAYLRAQLDRDPEAVQAALADYLDLIAAALSAAQAQAAAAVAATQGLPQ